MSLSLRLTERTLPLKKEKEQQAKRKKEVKNERTQRKVDSKLRHAAKKSNEASDRKQYSEILSEQMKEGYHIYALKDQTVFLSSVTAGLEIGFSYLFVLSVYYFFQDYFEPTILMRMFAFVYPVGFIMVILGKSILFTEQTSLLALPVLNNKRSVSELLRIWGIVISGNVVGGILISFFLIYLGPKLDLFHLDTIEKVTEHVIHQNTLVLLASSIAAGWLMGLLSWLLSSATDTMSRLAMIIMITGMIGFAGFHHSIVGNIEVFAGFVISPHVSLVDYLLFLLLALLGNALGGVVFVALLKYRAFVSNFD